MYGGQHCATREAADVDGLAEIFERTLLEVSILESLRGGAASYDRVTRVLRAAVQQLRGGSGVLLDAATQSWTVDAEEKRSPDAPWLDDDDDEPLEKRASPSRKRMGSMDDEERIGAMERRVIRRETEKNYVIKWEKARVENHKFRFGSKELEQRRKIADLQTELRASKIVDSENTKYLDYSINELEKRIKYWELKYETDTMEMDEKLKNLKTALKEKTVQVETLKETYDERQAVIDEHVTNKRKLEEEKKTNELRERMAVRIQAWWRGTMVRRRVGPYKHLLAPRKKSIKKSMSTKGDKTKIKQKI